MSGIGQLYRSKADDDKKSLQAAAFGKVTSEIRNLDEAVANLQRLANEKGIAEEPKWASRFTTAVNTASKHIDELYSRVDQLDAELSNFMRLFLADIKKEIINVPVQKKAENGRPLETMPHQKGEVKRKKRRTPTLAPSAASSTGPAGATGSASSAKAILSAAKRKKKEEEGPKKKKQKKSKVLPLPGTVKAEVK